MNLAESIRLLTPESSYQPAEFTRLPRAWNEQRAADLLETLAERGINSVLLTDPWNIVYFTGLWAATTERPLYALLSAGQEAPYWFYPTLDRDLVHEWWFGDGLEYFDYPHVAGQFPHLGHASRGPAVDLWEMALGGMRDSGRVAGHVVGIDRMPAGERAMAAARILGGPLHDVSSVCTEMRMHKTPEELALIKRTYTYFDEVHAYARQRLLEEGPMTDFDLRMSMIDFATKRIVPDLELDGRPHRGVGVVIDLAWVRAGAVTGYPHPNQFRFAAITADTVLQVSGVLQVGGYGGECYRPYLFQERTPHMERVWQVVRDSCLLQQEELRAGVACGEVAERIHRFQIAEGMAELIYHRPAHGQGPERHQPPWLALGDDTVLEPGMCFSVEPGLYDPAAGFSVNFSDTFVVQESGPAVAMSRVPWTEEWAWIDL
ncbi:aminopeptidase P family protein [Microbacterium esteraromaticum]|uniref:Aminopeptidase P family protein n=1 Tax=Microbacterium esteraromaticum TaxID=57043 RepID=A0A7D8AJE6_9MICO|nr:M24 family metallopeptidase [Microbacterium esteraromaticum]QMU95907.1 aminopeptidase P family protein [Microbacterium esteraromaticum]